MEKPSNKLPTKAQILKALSEIREMKSILTQLRDKANNAEWQLTVLGASEDPDFGRDERTMEPDYDDDIPF